MSISHSDNADNNQSRDETRQLPELDPPQFPNTDFGAGQGPGTANEPRRLSCAEIECAYASDTGRKKDGNEDSAVAFLAMVERMQMPLGFFVVADGVSGLDAGEVASNLAVRNMLDGVMRDFYLPAKEGRPLGVAGETPTDIMAGLMAAANQAILAERKKRPRHSMGTTLSALVLFGSMGITGHVGDSRIYGVERDGAQLRRLTREHTMVQILVEAGTLTPEEALTHPKRHVVYQVLGQNESINPDTEALSLADFSQLLLCSDGLWDLVDDTAIARILTTAPTPGVACQQLIQAANEAGGKDNITVIVVKL